MKGLSIEQAFDLICEIPNGSIICEILDHILKKERKISITSMKKEEHYFIAPPSKIMNRLWKS